MFLVYSKVNSVIHIYILSHYGLYSGYWLQCPVLCSRTLSFIRSIYNSWRLLISNFHSTFPHSLGNYSPFSMDFSVFLCCWGVGDLPIPDQIPCLGTLTMPPHILRLSLTKNEYSVWILAKWKITGLKEAAEKLMFWQVLLIGARLIQ